MTQDSIVPYGKHQGKKWSEIPRSYLEFIANGDGSALSIRCIDELEKRKARIKPINILPSAIDSASFSILNKWHDAFKSGEFSGGFYSYVTAIGIQAFNDGESDSHGNVYYRNFHFKFSLGRIYPTLISINSTIPK